MFNGSLSSKPASAAFPKTKASLSPPNPLIFFDFSHINAPFYRFSPSLCLFLLIENGVSRLHFILLLPNLLEGALLFIPLFSPTRMISSNL